MPLQTPDTSESSRREPPTPAAPLVSVVIPTYNRAALIKRAIQSALQQTYNNLEVLVVDDASTDETSAVVKKFGDPRIRYICHEKNRGGAATRNTGINSATGQYIAFLDDDDEWEPEKTQEQLSMLRRLKFDAALCMYSMAGRLVVSRYVDTVVSLDELRRGFVRGGSASALMARADVLKEISFDETLPKCQDWDLCIRIAGQYRLGCLNAALVRYNDGAHDRISNRISRLAAEQLIEQLRMLDKHKEFFGPVWYRRHMCQFLLYGVSRRPDKLKHLQYVVERFGALQVIRIVGARLAQHLLRQPRGAGVS